MAGPITCLKMGQGHEDRGRTSIYWWWYSGKKCLMGRKNGGSKEATNVSTHTDSRWCAPSWLHNMKCQHIRASLNPSEKSVGGIQGQSREQIRLQEILSEDN